MLICAASLRSSQMDAVEAVPAATLSADAVLGDPRHFIDRELSSLAFDERVLEEAADPQVPLLERLKFLSILSSNLDEFFMIRVAGLKQQLSGHVEETGPDAMTPSEQLQAISEKCHELVARQERILVEELMPGLEKAGIRVLRDRPLAPDAAAFAASYFEREVVPVLTPMALDPAHP